MSAPASSVQKELALMPFEQTNMHLIRKNSLFNFMKTLNFNSLPFMKGLKVQKIERSDRQAYIINLSNKLHPLYLNGNKYEFVEHHLTIDAIYAKDNSSLAKRGFSCAHYTARFKDLKSEEIITLHVYYNRQAQIIAYQAKNSIGETIALNGEMENMLANLSAEANSLLYQLLNIKAENYWLAKEKADDKEALLTKLSYNLSDKDTVSSYLIAANELIDLIERVNYFNDDIIDRRAQMVADVISAIKKRINKSTQHLKLEEQNVDIPLIEEGIKEEAASAEKNVVNELADPHKEAVGKKLHALNLKLDEALASQELSLLIKANIEARISSLDLLEFMLLENLTKSDKEFLENLNNKMKRLPNVSNLFKESFTRGLSEEFILLYSSVPNQIPKNLFTDILFYLILNPQEEKYVEAQMKICEHLHDNSEEYRQLILTLSNTLHYIKKTDNIGRSLLVIVAADHKNLSLFAMLLRHGFDPNGPGIYFNDLYLSTFRIMLIQGDPEYVKCMLAHGASFNKPLQLQIADMQNKKHQTAFQKLPQDMKSMVKQSVHHLAKIKNQNMETPKMLEEAAKTESDLMVIFRNARTEVLPFIKERVTLDEIALCLSEISSSENCCSRFLPYATIPGIAYAPNPSAANVITEKELAERDLLNHTVKWVLYTRPNDALTYNMLASFGEIFKEKCLSNSHEIIKGIERLKNKIETTHDKNAKAKLYKAIIFLMSEFSPLDFLQTQAIMQMFCKFSAALKSLGERHAEYGAAFLFNAQQIACYSPHIEKLSKTPIFSYIVEKSKTLLEEMTTYLSLTDSPAALSENKNGAPILHSYSNAQSASGSIAATSAPADLQQQGTKAKNVKNKK